MFITLEVPINELQIPTTIMKHCIFKETIKMENKSLLLKGDLQSQKNKSRQKEIGINMFRAANPFK